MIIQATIVRILKSRKVIQHKDLIAEVLNLLQGKFKVEVSMLKKCIETLIEKGYIERGSGDDSYHYVA